MQFPATPGLVLLPVLVSGPSPILAERPCAQFPAIPGWGLLLVVVGGPSPILAEGPGCNSSSFLARVCYPWWWVLLPAWGSKSWSVCVLGQDT